MRFMFMIHHDEDELRALPEGEMRALIDGALEYTDELRRTGHYIVSDALEFSPTARTIRVRGGKVSATDGPFAETKEQLGGFWIITAPDLDAALAWAAKGSAACAGPVEVRPFADEPPQV